MKNTGKHPHGLTTRDVAAQANTDRLAGIATAHLGQAQRFAADVAHQADTVASERAKVIASLQAVERRMTSLTAQLQRAEAHHAATAREATDAAALRDLGLPHAEPATEAEQVAIAADQVADIRADLDKAKALVGTLEAQAAGLLHQETALRQEAADAPRVAMQAEKAELIADALRLRAAYLESVQKAGQWNLAHGLGDLSGAEALRAPVQAIGLADVRPDPALDAQLLRPRVGGYLLDLVTPAE